MKNSETKTPAVAAFAIDIPGAVVVNGGWVEARGPDLVALTFDLKTKHAAIAGSMHGGDKPTAPGVFLSGEHAFHINKAKKGVDTLITFPEYIGWRVHCAEVARYTLKVCLVQGTSW